MKPISSISALALAMQTVWTVPVFSAPMMPTPQDGALATSQYLIDCHDEGTSESEIEPQFSDTHVPVLPLGDMPGNALILRSDCDTNSGETKKTSVKQTREVTRSIESVNDRCDDVPIRLRIDCIAQRYEILAQSPELTGEYSEVKEALLSAAKRLRNVAEDAGDKDAKERLVIERNGKNVAVGRPLTPTRPEAQEEAFARAVKIIEETETILLRSAGNSKRRQVSYQRIAQALDSNKVLLRS